MKRVLLIILGLTLGGSVACTGQESETERAESCDVAVSLLDRMVEAEQFQRSDEFAELNSDLATIEAPGEVAAAVERVQATTAAWIEVMGDIREGDERANQVRDDLLEARMALRRVCR